MIWVLIIWATLITAFTLIGAAYAKKYNRPDALIGLYVAFVLVSNIIAFKIVTFDLGFTLIVAPASVLFFSVTFLMTDIVNERFGRFETYKMVFIAFLTQVAATFFIWLAISFPAAPFWGDQIIFKKVFGFMPRIILASWIAFLISENLDAYIFFRFKKLTRGGYVWVRNVFSSMPAMLIDSILFVGIAFYGIQPVWQIIFGTVVLKWGVAVLNIPFMYLSRKIMRE